MNSRLALVGRLEVVSAECDTRRRTPRPRMRRLLFLTLFLCLLAPASAAAAPARTPRVGIFYYSWYSTEPRDGAYGHWTQNNRPAPFQIASNFFPARGVYSSSDPVVLHAQMREIRGAGVDEVIVSWWGTGSVEDQRLPAVLKAARAEHLTVALHIDATRVLGWAFAQAVLSAVWDWEDGAPAESGAPALLLARTLDTMLHSS